MEPAVATVVPEVEARAIVIQADPSGVTLRVVGEVDGDAWPSLERALLACVEVEPGRIVLDLAAVPFVSAAACRQLDATLRTLRLAGRPVALEPSRPLARVAELTHATAVLAAAAASPTSV